MKEECTVICNEQHTITPQQMSLLEASYQTINTLPVPAAGWTAAQQQDQYLRLRGSDSSGDIIFLSPLPMMLAVAAYESGYRAAYNMWAPSTGITLSSPDVYVFHNSRRDRREKDGKVWYTVPQDGWELLYVASPTSPPVTTRKDNAQCDTCVAKWGDCVPPGSGDCKEFLKQSDKGLLKEPSIYCRCCINWHDDCIPEPDGSCYNWRQG